jgi:hypothetical protein
MDFFLADDMAFELAQPLAPEPAESRAEALDAQVATIETAFYDAKLEMERDDAAMNAFLAALMESHNEAQQSASQANKTDEETRSKIGKNFKG